MPTGEHKEKEKRKVVAKSNKEVNMHYLNVYEMCNMEKLCEDTSKFPYIGNVMC